MDPSKLDGCVLLLLASVVFWCVLALVIVMAVR